MSLSASQIDQFHQDGFLIIPDFFDAEPVLEQARRLIHDFDPVGHPLTKFSTGEDDEKESDKHVGDRYFLESGDKIRYFLEQDAVDPQTGKLNRAPDLCVNKCGHALHALDPTFHGLTFSDKVQGVIRSLDMLKDPRCLQSMVICKQPSIGGAVPAHNDSTFLYTSPPSAIGLWFALEDCTESNGCLSFLPGSHRFAESSASKAPAPDAPRPTNESDEVTSTYGQPRGVNKRFIRSDPANVDAGTTFITLGEGEEEAWNDERAVTAACKAGTLVLIHGSVMHKSERNESDKSRYIYTFHCIEGDERKARYDQRNWLQPSEAVPFSKLYDAPAIAA